jgi:hypothetical protein
MPKAPGPRQRTAADIACEKRRGERRRAATAAKRQVEGIAWADSQPGRRGPEWEDAMTRTELLTLRGYDV